MEKIDFIIRFIVLCQVPTIILWTADTIKRMDAGEKMWFDKITDWFTSIETEQDKKGEA